MFQIRNSVLRDAVDVAKIHVRAWQESYVGIVDDNYLDNLSFKDKLALREKILTSNSQNELHLVVVCDDEIIGFCDAGKDFSTANGVGGLYAIYLLDKYKGHKLGLQLFNQVKQHFHVLGVSKFIAWVLKNNASAGEFYAKLGGKIIDGKQVLIGGKLYSEICFIFTTD